MSNDRSPQLRTRRSRWWGALIAGAWLTASCGRLGYGPRSPREAGAVLPTSDAVSVDQGPTVDALDSEATQHDAGERDALVDDPLVDDAHDDARRTDERLDTALSDATFDASLDARLDAATDAVALADDEPREAPSDAVDDAAPSDGARDGALRCPPGLADCNGLEEDGCEVVLANDAAHCGACSVRCAAGCEDGVCFTATHVAAGVLFSCANTSLGSVYCWGANSSAQLASDDPSASRRPRRATRLPSGMTGELAAGINFACGVREDRTVRCWGSNESSERGVGTMGGDPPIAEPTGLGAVDALAVGGSFACAIRSRDGALVCWGDNGGGQLGVSMGDAGSSAREPIPVVVTIPSRARRVACGGSHTCILGEDTKVYCWGNDSLGQLGRGAVGAPSSNPAEIAVGPIDVSVDSRLDLGASTSCVATPVAGATRLFCWGSNSMGQLGSTPSAPPVLVARMLLDEPVNLLDLSVGVFHAALAVRASSGIEGLRVFGSNAQGQCGVAPVQAFLPVQTLAAPRAIAVAAGGSHTCVLTHEGNVECAGTNGTGELGDGTTESPRAAFRPVAW